MRDGDYFDDYVVVDIETTGLRSSDEIVEIGALKVRGHQVVETFCSLVHPSRPIPPSATLIHGITNSMVKDASPVDVVLDDFFAFVGDDIVIGHNIASFDLPFIRRYSGSRGYSFGRRYVDTLYVAKRKLPQLGSYTLARLSACLAVEETSKHRALGDCYSTYSCYEKLMNPKGSEVSAIHLPDRREKSFAVKGAKRTDKTTALQELQVILMDITADQEISRSEVDELQKWMSMHQELRGNYPYDKVISQVEQALEDGVLTAEEIDRLLHVFLSCIYPVSDTATETSISFEGKNICVSGEFLFGSRNDVRLLIESCGACWKDSVTKKTDALIIGECGSDAWACGSYGGKIKKAMELLSCGCEIAILQESKVAIFRASGAK